MMTEDELQEYVRELESELGEMRRHFKDACASVSKVSREKEALEQELHRLQLDYITLLGQEEWKPTP